jgi:HAD superfamily hydrolase (TIGR01509 family)
MRDVWEALRPRFPRRLAETEWLGAIEDFYVAHRAEIAPMPEAVETIRILTELGAMQVCVSNSGRRVVDANLQALGVGEHIRFSISLDDVAAGKPNPEPYLSACRKLRLEPAEVVAVEDSPSGARSARAAGLFLVEYAPTASRFEDCDAWIDRLSRVIPLFSD